MKIRYLGHSSFYIRTKKAKIVTDPFDPQMVGFSFLRQEADIVTISHHHKDHDRADLVKGAPLVIDLPGEYEKLGVKIIGYSTFHDAKKGSERGENTIFKIEAENLSLLHLGDLGHILSDSLIEEIGEINVLFIPIGGFYTIGPKEAVELIGKIEPSVVIPMHYNHSLLNPQVFSKLFSLEDFLRLIDDYERVDTFELSQQSLEGKEKQVVILNLPKK